MLKMKKQIISKALKQFDRFLKSDNFKPAKGALIRNQKGQWVYVRG